MRWLILAALAGSIAGAVFTGKPTIAQTGRMPAPPTQGGRGASGLVWTVPAAWREESPASSMRRAQYRVPGPGGDGECAVFYFGPGQGGDAKANLARWAGQFRTTDDKPIGAGFKTRELTVGGMHVTVAEATGTYVGGMGGGPVVPSRANQMMLAAIAEGPDANWFFRALGPKATMEAQRAAFEQMIRSIKHGPAP
jgi:hypothetical protein